MRRHGYSPALATGTLAAGGTLGILIPPSVILVIYAIYTEQSIGVLFIAAVMPGLIATRGLHAGGQPLRARCVPGAAPPAERMPVARALAPDAGSLAGHPGLRAGGAPACMPAGSARPRARRSAPRRPACWR